MPPPEEGSGQHEGSDLKVILGASMVHKDKRSEVREKQEEGSANGAYE
jgi:hypothetical protein